MIPGRSKMLTWGATTAEVHGEMPGDDLVAGADLTATRAITVQCPRESAWQWIAQLGQGRGGFYSYDYLENLAGCDIHSAEQIVPAWQDVHVGDEVRLFPDGGLTVAIADPERALVLLGTTSGSTPMPFEFSWAFVLLDDAAGGSRLVVRERYRYSHRWVGFLVEPVSVVSFVMTRKMLRGIRERAERGAPS